VSADQGNRLWIKAIHEKDQFLQDITPVMFELAHSYNAEHTDYWSTQNNIKLHPKPVRRQTF